MSGFLLWRELTGKRTKRFLDADNDSVIYGRDECRPVHPLDLVAERRISRRLLRGGYDGDTDNRGASHHPDRLESAGYDRLLPGRSWYAAHLRAAESGCSRGDPSLL